LGGGCYGNGFLRAKKSVKMCQVGIIDYFVGFGCWGVWADLSLGRKGEKRREVRRKKEGSYEGGKREKIEEDT
jgi:hypothetical protein